MKKIKQCHLNNNSIRKSEIENEIFDQNDIKYLFKLLKRDEIIKKEMNISKNKDEKFPDPFEPPIEEGMLIDENFTKSHRLCFNKFPILDFHCILATKQDINQNTHLSEQDLCSLALLIKILNGYGFFNGGFNAGASQPHKHLQAIPYEFNREYGIFLVIKNENNLDKLDLNANHVNFTFYKLKIFDFSHLLIKFSDKIKDLFLSLTNENLEIIGKALQVIYFAGLEYLELKTDPIKITNDYSVMLTEEWMFIAPRKTNKVQLEKGFLNLNSACYTLTILVKTESLKEEIKCMEINQIFKRLSV